MKSKKLLKIFAILLGIVISFGFSKVKAAENITSVFDNTTFSRAGIAASSTKYGITRFRGENIYAYKKKNQSIIWKVVKVNDNDKIVKNDKQLIYCLDATRGFEDPDTNDDPSSIADYTSQIDVNKITEVLELSDEEYNKVLWIIDNIYIPTGKTNYQESDEYKELMDKAEIDIDDSKTDMNLTEEDIDAIQQMAIWKITNSEDAPYNTFNIYVNETNLSNGKDEDGNTIDGRLNKSKELYEYFTMKADSDYNYSNLSKKPDLSIDETKVTISEYGDYYIFGPYELKGENTEKIKSIQVEATKDYTLLDSSEKDVENNDFSKVINNEFYLKIDKSEITDSTKIKLQFTYKYDIRNLVFMTGDNQEKTQPIVIIENTEKDKYLEFNIDLIEINVEKTWNDNENQDGKRPESITVNLLANGAEIKEKVVTEADNWQYSFTGLLKYENGKEEIEYTITEDVVEDYTSNITGNMTSGFTITNQYTPEEVEISGTKTWQDENNQDGKRPESITVNLLANGTEIKEKVVTEADNWKYSFTGLPKYENGKEIIYTITEDVVANYKTTYNGYNITNEYTPGKTSLKVIKEWNDQNDKDEIRPENIIIKLYKAVSGQKTQIDLQTLNQSNNWMYIWSDLPEKENGIDIIYSIEEISVEGYTITYSSMDYSNTNEITITNTHVPEITGKYNVLLRKLNENGNKLNGATFKVNGKEYNLTEGEIFILQEADLTSTDDIILNYNIEETKAPEGYKEIEDTSISLKAKVEEIDDSYKVTKVELLDEEGNNTSSENINIKLEGNTIAIEVENAPVEKEFDLALRKFITQVNEQKYNREPVVDTSTIATVGTATYRHAKTPIVVKKGDIVTYTIRVYNEGEIDGYVDKITDHLPSNLIPIIDGVESIDSEKYKEEIEFNSNWLWMCLDDGKTVTTTITSKSNTDTYSILTGIEEKADTKLDAYVEGSNKLDYIDVQIKCLVSDEALTDEYITNIAEITDAQDINGKHGDGSDSSLANVDYSNLSDYKNNEAINSSSNSYIPGQEDDDDFEKLVVKEFDLALRKFITKVNEKSYSREPKVDTSKLRTLDRNGNIITTATYKHSKEPVIVETGDIITYTIRVYNEGTLDGYANEITDNLPEGLEFLPNSSVNTEYKWKMLDSEGNETDDISKAVMITTDYLSDADENNIIKAVSEENGEKVLSYRDVEVQFKVIAKAEKGKENIIKNVAQISEDSSDDTDSIPNRDEEYDYETGDNEDDIDYEPIKLQYFDLALRKFITKVNSTDYNNRYPEIIYTENGNITYRHTKDPVLVQTGDIVIYTIRVYNEGEKAGYATEITDNLPEGLEFVIENEINKEYKWKLLDSEGNITEDITKAEKVTTDYLKDEIIEALIITDNQKILSYKDVQIAFKVTEPNTSDRILVNVAEITEDSDDDIDSEPDNGVETEDDIDKEYVKVQYFDLALKKWVTATKVTYNGKTTTTKTGFTEDSEGIAKVDLVASKMKKTTVKFVYSIKVTNEGELPGYAYEVKDYIPNGLKFVQADNKDWKQLEDGTVVTDKLKDTLLNPGESATVEIVLTWKNSTTNLGVKTNYAEISKDSANDIDSTPDNYNLKEDDIDDAKVILSIKTAGVRTYAGLILITVAILAGGVFLIKKYVIE